MMISAHNHEQNKNQVGGIDFEYLRIQNYFSYIILYHILDRCFIIKIKHRTYGKF